MLACLQLCQKSVLKLLILVGFGIEGSMVCVCVSAKHCSSLISHPQLEKVTASLIVYTAWTCFALPTEENNDMVSYLIWLHKIRKEHSNSFDSACIWIAKTRLETSFSSLDLAMYSMITRTKKSWRGFKNASLWNSNIYWFLKFLRQELSPTFTSWKPHPTASSTSEPSGYFAGTTWGNPKDLPHWNFWDRFHHEYQPWARLWGTSFQPGNLMFGPTCILYIKRKQREKNSLQPKVEWKKSGNHGITLRETDSYKLSLKHAKNISQTGYGSQILFLLQFTNRQ